MVLFAALLAAVALVTPARTFTDPVGDAAGAPDISAVDVASDGVALTFTIRTTSAADWDGAAAILEVDTDASAANGFELSYVVHSEHTQITLGRASGPSPTSATFAFSGATLMIHVPSSELGT